LFFYFKNAPPADCAVEKLQLTKCAWVAALAGLLYVLFKDISVNCVAKLVIILIVQIICEKSY